MSKKKKEIKVKLACTYGKEKPGSIVSLDEDLAKGLIGQGMASKHVADGPLADSGSGDAQLEKELSAEKAKSKQLEEAIKVHEDTIKTLEGRIENGGKGFDLLVGSIRELDPKSEDLAAKVEELQRSLGEPENSSDAPKASKKK